MRRVHRLLGSVLSRTPAALHATTGAGPSPEFPPAARRPVQSRWMLLFVVPLVLSVGVESAPATPAPTLLDIPFYSQFDPDWAHDLIGAGEDVPMRKMGSLLTCVAMVASASHLVVKFPVPGTDASLSPTPDYIHVYLRDHGGYRPGPPKTVIMTTTP